MEPECFERLLRDDRSVALKVLDTVKDFIRKVKWAISGHDWQNQAAQETFGVSLDTPGAGGPAVGERPSSWPGDGLAGGGAGW